MQWPKPVVCIEEIVNTSKTLVWKNEGEKLFWKYVHRWKDDIKMGV